MNTPASQPVSPAARYAGMTRAGICVMACANVTPDELAALIDDGGLRKFIDHLRGLLALKCDADRLPTLEKLLRQGVELAQTIAVGEGGVAQVEASVRDWLRRVEFSRTNGAADGAD